MNGVFDGLLPNDILVEETELSAIAGDGQSLFPQEVAGLGRVILKRRREFEAGRMLARRAMKQLGLESLPILIGPYRAPLWPEGIIGSITHSTGRCAAAVTRSTCYRGLGIDLEPDEPIEDGLFNMICTPFELDTLNCLTTVDRGRYCRTIFCAKEAAYKAQFTVSQTYLPFSAMSIVIYDDNRFEAKLNVEVGTYFPRGHVFTGALTRKNGYIATTVALPRRTTGRVG